MSSCIRAAVVVSLLALLNVAHAQDTSTPQTGYAIVTTVSGNPAGLLLVETLVSQESGIVFQADASPMPLVTSGTLKVNLGGSFESDTGLAIVNTTTSVGHVLLVVTNSNGIEILRKTITVLPRSQFISFLSEIFDDRIILTTSPFGVLTFTSDFPVALLALNFRQFDFTATTLTSLSSSFAPPPITVGPPRVTGVPPLSGVPNVAVTSGPNVSVTVPGTIGGPGAFVFPQVVSGGGWSTEVAIANTSSAPQTVRIDFFSPHGLLVASRENVIIASRGLATFLVGSGGIIPATR